LVSNANISIDNKATLYINSTDTDWLKINSTAGVAYSIIARGNSNKVIDHSKISSWNSSANNFAKLKSGTEPRAYLVVSGSGGQMNITNSNLSYLGYVPFNQAGGERGYMNGIAYYSGNGSIIKNNIISYNYRGFYSAGVSHITIENNRVFNNFECGLDPHTGTSDLKVYSNVINNNGDHGIICSQLCSHIIIENNTVYNNKGHGIDLDLYVRDSTVSNNQAYGNNYSGVGIWASHGNLIKNNVLDNNSFGIVVTHGSYNNSIKDNLINDSKSYGIYICANSTKNKFQVNTISRSKGTKFIYKTMIQLAIYLLETK
jgi:parallel beta-helix repeat protein